MLRKILVFTFIILAGGFHLSLTASTVNNESKNFTDCITPTSNDIPQWSELGMENVLTAGEETSVSAPQSGSRLAGRNHTNNFSPRGHHDDEGDRLIDSLFQLAGFTQAHAVGMPTRVIDYYIYYIYCLRL